MSATEPLLFGVGNHELGEGRRPDGGPGPGYLTAQHVKRLLGYAHVASVQQLVQRKRLAPVAGDRATGYLFDRDDVERYARNRRRLPFRHQGCRPVDAHLAVYNPAQEADWTEAEATRLARLALDLRRTPTRAAQDAAEVVLGVRSTLLRQLWRLRAPTVDSLEATA